MVNAAESVVESSKVRARARAFAQVVAVVLLVSPALAQAEYPGQEALTFAAKFIIAPLGLFSLIIAMAAAFFRPEYVKQAIYSVIICAVLFFLVYQGESLFKVLGRQ